MLLPPAVPSQSSGRVAVNGYAEFRHGDTIIVDGQRVRATPATRVRAGEFRSLAASPLGYEVEAEDTRQPDGVIVATTVEAMWLDSNRVRIHLVDTKEWNAAAMGNGAIWVYTGLVRDMTADELAIVVGHEIGHFTHEHSRRQARRGSGRRSSGWARCSRPRPSTTTPRACQPSSAPCSA
jgi:Peptidase family M48/Domain of unknown function (DUF5666)